MVFKNERQLIESYVQDNFSSAPVKYDNVPFDEPSNSPFVALSILSEAGEDISVGESPIQKYNGMIQFDVYVPQNTGTAKARDVASSLRTLFNNKILEDVGDTTTIYCAVPTLNRVAKTPTGSYRVSVIVPYEMLSQVS